MSTLASRVHPCFKESTLKRFDPEVGYVRIPKKRILELTERYDALVKEGRLSKKERIRLLSEIDSTNERCAEIDACIKESRGQDHFYGEEGMPLLVEDRMAYDG